MGMSFLLIFPSHQNFPVVYRKYFCAQIGRELSTLPTKYGIQYIFLQNRQCVSTELILSTDEHSEVGSCNKWFERSWVLLSNCGMKYSSPLTTKETPRSRITVTSSSNEISTDQSGDRVVVRGEALLRPPPPLSTVCFWIYILYI